MYDVIFNSDACTALHRVISKEVHRCTCLHGVARTVAPEEDTITIKAKCNPSSIS
jgi:hypothetical protein